MTAVLDPIFRVTEVSLAYPGRRGQPPAQILRDVSVTVERGGALTLVGPSGSGKSSLLRCLNRLEEPSGGSVVFEGRAITEWDPRELRRRAALVLQTPVLFEGTSGRTSPSARRGWCSTSPRAGCARPWPRSGSTRACSTARRPRCRGARSSA